jgi:hypothetical protein
MYGHIIVLDSNTRLLGQRPYKFFDVGHADAGDHVLARTCAEFTIGSHLDIPKTR